MEPKVAYLAEGKLFLKESGKPPRLVESRFAQQQTDRIERNRQRNNWKSEGLSWQFGAAGMRGMNPTDAYEHKMRMSGLTRGEKPGELVYALQSGAIGGLFQWNPADDSERRMFHRNQFRAHDLCRRAADGALALSMITEDGAANLAIMEPNGRGVREITEGDSLDQAPSWVPGDHRELVYQTAGIGRNAHGFPVGQGPYAVMRLDLVSGEMTTLLESDDKDYLVPRVGADQSLYYIRRPYQTHEPVSPAKVALDILLFPYRLVRAIVHFLNFFSMVFSRKPLITAAGPPKEAPDARYMMLWGKLIDAEKIMRDKSSANGSSLVPNSWELMKRPKDGSDEVLAKGVLAFDLCDDGTVVFTNGAVVYQLDPGAKATELCKGKLIERIVVAG